MDVVVTVPLTFGLDRWIDEGDPAGAPWSGQEWDFYLGGMRPKMKPGDRVYVVFNQALRGYAPLVRIGSESMMRGSFSLVRHGGAVAVTIPRAIPGFRGWRYRDWDRSIEVPFPNWQDPNACIGWERTARQWLGKRPGPVRVSAQVYVRRCGNADEHVHQWAPALSGPYEVCMAPRCPAVRRVGEEG